jgi:hypothetical protein
MEGTENRAAFCISSALLTMGETGPSWQMIAMGALVVINGLGAWIANTVRGEVREVKDGQKELHEAVIRMDTALFGAKGDNGLSSEVKGLRSRVHHLGNQMQRMPGYRLENEE